jgi:hypothetical protein
VAWPGSGARRPGAPGAPSAVAGNGRPTPKSAEASSRALLERAEALAKRGDVAGGERAIAALARLEAMGADAARTEALRVRAKKQRDDASAERALAAAAAGAFEEASRIFLELPPDATGHLLTAGGLLCRRALWRHRGARRPDRTGHTRSGRQGFGRPCSTRPRKARPRPWASRRAPSATARRLSVPSIALADHTEAPAGSTFAVVDERLLAFEATGDGPANWALFDAATGEARGELCGPHPSASSGADGATYHRVAGAVVGRRDEQGGTHRGPINLRPDDP